MVTLRFKLIFNLEVSLACPAVIFGSPAVSFGVVADPADRSNAQCCVVPTLNISTSIMVKPKNWPSRGK